MYAMCFRRLWTWWTFMVSEIWYLLTKRNSLILAWHTLIYFMQKLEHFRQCPWQKVFPHITLIRSDTDFTKWMNCKCIIYSFGMILFWVGASQMAFDKFYLVLIHMYLKKLFSLKEVNKIMSFRDKMYLITFRHQCIWIYLHLIIQKIF